MEDQVKYYAVTRLYYSPSVLPVLRETEKTITYREEERYSRRRDHRRANKNGRVFRFETLAEAEAFRDRWNAFDRERAAERDLFNKGQDAAYEAFFDSVKVFEPSDEAP